MPFLNCLECAESHTDCQLINAQGKCTREMHKGNAQGECTRGMHKGNAQGECTRGMHKGNAQGECTSMSTPPESSVQQASGACFNQKRATRTRTVHNPRSSKGDFANHPSLQFPLIIASVGTITLMQRRRSNLVSTLFETTHFVTER